MVKRKATPRRRNYTGGVMLFRRPKYKRMTIYGKGAFKSKMPRYHVQRFGRNEPRGRRNPFVARYLKGRTWKYT